ncbi:hypothetical protein GGF32_006956 [Allomyces javanicus]|nr:hypothetical protein GGF32_006956 [Allomyces javanicus]KAJ3368066.1 hypothetical protein GGF31_006899 [Allomyces arbusculus]
MPSPYPEPDDTCSISDALSAVYTCYSFKYQALSYYRYGTKSDCTAKWEQFKFCLSVKPKPAEEAREMIRERRAVLEAEAKKKPSSLDVWELRDKPPENFPPEADWSTHPLVDTSTTAV